MRCNNCGYQNQANVLRCVKCNYPLKGSLNVSEFPDQPKKPDFEPNATLKGELPDVGSWDADTQKPNTPAPSTGQQSGSQRERKAPFGGTIDPTRSPNVVLPSVKLVRLPRQGEQESEIILSEEQNVLNRDNCDPGNRSITSKEQAAIEYRDGGWYLSDRSSLKTTYIRVTSETKLKNGDVILLGDRAFKVVLDC